MTWYQALFVDIDGTIYFKGQLIEGAIDFLKELKENDVAIRYLTNTTSISPSKIVERLNSYGLDVTDQECFTPITAAQVYLEKHRNLSYYVAASPDLKREFDQSRWNDADPDCVVLGELREVCSYEELNKIFTFISHGSRLFSTSYSPYFYTATGEKKMDTGAFARMFEACLQIKAEIIGKPAPLFYQMALASVDIDTNQCIAVGDDIDTDILGANQVDIFSVLVKTGKYDEAYVKASNIAPDAIVTSLSETRKFFQSLYFANISP
jgi:HAD superfamily hydrolase (TIGR01458 family)